jgi:hypothetical protein
MVIETEKSFTPLEAITEAKRCLNCKVPLCRKGCPISNDIPGFIHQLSMGNMGEAMKVINQTSNLSAICGRVCPHERQCQGHCVWNKKGKPIQIGKLESFVADFDAQMSLTKENIPQKTRGKVAVIGIGTHFTNDFPHIRPMNTVIKLTAAKITESWPFYNDTCKISEDDGKHTGKPEVIRRFMEAIHFEDNGTDGK